MGVFAVTSRAVVVCMASLAFVLLAAPAHAKLSTRCAGAADRIALVVTNATYGGRLSDLPSTAEDGRLIADALCAQNFTVRQINDADLTTLRGALATFQQDVQDAPRKAIGFFYYSGHGAQSTLIGESYLIPARAPIERRAQLTVQAIGIGEVLRGVRAAAAGANKNVFVVLDACRDVAFPGETLSTGEKGIGAVPKQEGLFIAYSTRPGETALANNVFSAALARNLAIPGKSAYDVFFDTRRDVLAKTKQFPWFEDGLIERVVLTQGAMPFADAPTPQQPPFDARGAELAYWNDCCANANASADTLQAYLNRVKRGDFPGTYKELAERRVRLKEQYGRALIDEPVGERIVSLPKPAAAPSAAEMRAGTVFRDCPTCPEMVMLPARSFVMGSPASETGREADEGPQRTVQISAFAAGRFEVTFDEWDACVADGGCKTIPVDQGWGRGRRPVMNVSWIDAKAYTAWLSRKTGQRYRLLTEAEWEYAARAGTTTPYWTGASISTSQARFNSSSTSLVGSFEANGFGLFDTAGNVWEWVEDCSTETYAGAPNDGSAVTGACSSYRVLRGGSWNNDPRYLRSAFRYDWSPDFRVLNLGFRLARTVSPPDR